MKRRGVWSVTIIIASALLYYYSTRNYFSSSSVPLPADKKQVVLNKDRSAIKSTEDLSSHFNTSSTVSGSKSSVASIVDDPEVVFFGDNPDRLVVKENFLPSTKNQATVLPTNLADLENSQIWPAGTWQVWQGVRVISGNNKSVQGDNLKELGTIGSYVLIED